ncbi:VOC family protein [Kitasatospora sp. NPDC059327]|uniref:VOC family protein n=1 Tax=Kitasatospora sp. NPDC059327 TaxID=3346803 RepID=UPI0036A8B288
MTSGFALERLHHVRLDIPAGADYGCRAFWREVLGMTEPVEPPVPAARGGRRFRDGGVEAHLGVVPEFRPARRGHPGFQAPKLDALAERLVAHGHEVVRDEDLPGHRRFHAADNLGNRLEFVEPPPTTGA